MGARATENHNDENPLTRRMEIILDRSDGDFLGRGKAYMMTGCEE